jgi:hypothetical protein
MDRHYNGMRRITEALGNAGQRTSMLIGKGTVLTYK